MQCIEEMSLENTFLIIKNNREIVQIISLHCVHAQICNNESHHYVQCNAPIKNVRKGKKIMERKVKSDY